MNRRIHALTWWTLLLAAPVAAEVVEQGIIAEGTPFETRWYSHDSEVDGPTILIVGGMHGNEPAGHRAARQIATWSVDAGRIVVIPAANPPALAKRTRRIPGLEDDAGDLNRHFPVTGADVDPTGPAAPAIWAFVLKRGGFCALPPLWKVGLPSFAWFPWYSSFSCAITRRSSARILGTTPRFFISTTIECIFFCI